MMAGDWLVGDFWGPMRDETRLFLERVTMGRSVSLALPEHARTVLEVTLAIEHSAKENRPIDFPLTGVHSHLSPIRGEFRTSDPALASKV